jgi:hypothetical protein
VEVPAGPGWRLQPTPGGGSSLRQVEVPGSLLLLLLFASHLLLFLSSPLFFFFLEHGELLHCGLLSMFVPNDTMNIGMR